MINVMGSVGFVLRKDDPSALKELIVKIQQKSSEKEVPQIELLNTMLRAVKNNNESKVRPLLIFIISLFFLFFIANYIVKKLLIKLNFIEYIHLTFFFTNHHLCIIYLHIPSYRCLTMTQHMLTV